MEKFCKNINFEDLQEGQFIIITYWHTGKSYILAKVLKDNQIEEISGSLSDRIRLDKIQGYFPLRNFIIKKKLIKNDDIIELQDSNISKRYVDNIYLVDTNIVKSMVKTKIIDDQKEIKKLQKEHERFKKTMRKVGVLEKQTKRPAKK